MKPRYKTNLPPELRVLKQEIEGFARDYGLDFYETIFEVIDAEDLNEIAAYGGFPTRYPHWSFGMSFEELKKGNPPYAAISDLRPSSRSSTPRTLTRSPRMADFPRAIRTGRSACPSRSSRREIRHTRRSPI